MCGEQPLLSIRVPLRIMKPISLLGMEMEVMTLRSKNLLERFPPGSSAKRYRATPEEIERNIREGKIQRERDERAWRRAMEKEKEASQTESQDKAE